MNHHAARRHMLTGGIVTAYAVVLLATPPVQATTYTWDAGGTTNRAWTTAANWVGDVLPPNDATADVVFSSSMNLNGTPAVGWIFLGTSNRAAGSITYDANAVTSLMYLANDNNEGSARDLTLGSSTVAPSITMASGSADQKIGNGAGSIILANNLTIANNASNILTIARPITGTGFSLTKTGTGTLSLSAVSTYDGGTFIKQGSIALGGGTDRLLATSSVTLGDSSSATTGKLALGSTGSARDQTLGGLFAVGSGGKVVGANATTNSVLTLNIASGTDTYDGTLGGTGTNENKLALIKQGGGVLVLTNANTYVGSTTISGGELRANNATGSTGTGTVTVGNGTNAATLGGNGTIANGTNAITVNNNATITAGASSATTGKLSTGDQVWKRGGQYKWKLASRTGTAGTAGGWDQLVMGSLNLSDLSGTNQFKIVAVGTGAMALQTGDSFSIATYTGTPVTTGTPSLASLFNLDVSQLINQTDNADTASDYGLSFTGSSVMLSYNGPQAAPEPGVASLVGLSGAAILGQRRRRRCAA